MVIARMWATYCIYVNFFIRIKMLNNIQEIFIDKITNKVGF